MSISRETVEILAQHRRRQIERRLAAGPSYQDNDLVFAAPSGEPMPPYTVSKGFSAIAKAAGVSPLRFHDLRHTHATLMLRLGVHPKIVSERLGHSTVGITLDVYSHVTPSMQAEVARQFDDVLANG